MVAVDVSRAQWGARPPVRTVGHVTQVRLEVHHSAGAVSSDPLQTVRAIQSLHLRAGNADVLYHLFITPDGRIVEGRGVGTKINSGLSADSLMVCVLGDFTHRLPSVAALNALRRLRDSLPVGWPVTYHGERGLAENKPTACPGVKLTEWIRLWRLEGSSVKGSFVKVDLPLLEQGASGGAVRSLQSLLVSKAAQDIRVDGRFDLATKEAVVNVQRFFGVNADGKVGPVTWGLLFL